MRKSFTRGRLRIVLSKARIDWTVDIEGNLIVTRSISAYDKIIGACYWAGLTIEKDGRAVPCNGLVTDL